MSQISVLHLSTTDNDGGSGRSAFKIHQGLLGKGFQSRMLVRRKVSHDPQVGLISEGWVKTADRICSKITDATGLQYCYLPSSRKLLAHPWFQEADIVQLYNTHGKLLSQSVLPQLTQAKRVAWRLSDMWPMTGHCGYAASCEKWRTGCQGCPDLKAYPSLKWDTAGLLWRQKRSLYARSSLEIVAPSLWISRLAGESPLLGRFPRTLIRNGVDLDVFRQTALQAARDDLEISQQGQGLLFISAVVRDARKGSQDFLEMVRRRWNSGKRDFFVMLVGAGVEDWHVELPCPVWKQGRITDDRKLAQVYNAADLIVHPAKVENLPNSLIEAMACGTPSVAYDAGGVGELVHHQKNGYLAKLGDIPALAAGCDWILSQPDRGEHLSRAARNIVHGEYSLEQQTNAFAHLYRQMMATGYSSIPQAA